MEEGLWILTSALCGRPSVRPRQEPGVVAIERETGRGRGGPLCREAAGSGSWGSVHWWANTNHGRVGD